MCLAGAESGSLGQVGTWNSHPWATQFGLLVYKPLTRRGSANPPCPLGAAPHPTGVSCSEKTFHVRTQSLAMAGFWGPCLWCVPDPRRQTGRPLDCSYNPWRAHCVLSRTGPHHVYRVPAWRPCKREHRQWDRETSVCPSVRSVHCIAWPGPGPRDVCQNPSP